MDANFLLSKNLVNNFLKQTGSFQSEKLYFVEILEQFFTDKKAVTRTTVLAQNFWAVENRRMSSVLWTYHLLRGLCKPDTNKKSKENFS